MASNASMTETIRETMGTSVSFKPAGIALAVERFHVMAKMSSAARSNPREHAQYAQPYSGCFFINAYSSASNFPGFRRRRRERQLFDIVKQRGNLQVLQHRLFEAEFLPTRMPHSARRVLCTPVFRSLRSRSW